MFNEKMLIISDFSHCSIYRLTAELVQLLLCKLSSVMRPYFNLYFQRACFVILHAFTYFFSMVLEIPFLSYIVAFTVPLITLLLYLRRRIFGAYQRGFNQSHIMVINPLYFNCS